MYAYVYACTCIRMYIHMHVFMFGSSIRHFVILYVAFLSGSGCLIQHTARNGNRLSLLHLYIFLTLRFLLTCRALTFHDPLLRNTFFFTILFTSFHKFSCLYPQEKRGLVLADDHYSLFRQTYQTISTGS